MDEAERAIAKGKDAERLLSEPLFVEAFKQVEEGLINTWRGSPADDPDARERIWLTINLLPKLKTYFERVVSEGKVATFRLDQEKMDKAFQDLNRSPHETYD